MYTTRLYRNFWRISSIATRTAFVSGPCVPPAHFAHHFSDSIKEEQGTPAQVEGKRKKQYHRRRVSRFLTVNGNLPRRRRGSHRRQHRTLALGRVVLIITRLRLLVALRPAAAADIDSALHLQTLLAHAHRPR